MAISHSKMVKKLLNQPVPNDIAVFNNIEQLNWAWLFEVEDGWKQFNCLECMVLEAKRRQWLETIKNQKLITESYTFKLAIGEIDFKRMVAVKIKDGVKTEFKVMRTINNNRQRPDAEKRHEDHDDQNRFLDKFRMINSKDLEWLAWNWRSWNN